MKSPKNTKEKRFLFIEVNESDRSKDKIYDKIIAVKKWNYYFFRLLYLSKSSYIKALINDHLERGKKYLVLESLFIYDKSNV